MFLGVHVSKVRSCTLDVKVWDTQVLEVRGLVGRGRDCGGKGGREEEGCGGGEAGERGRGREREAGGREWRGVGGRETHWCGNCGY